MPPDAVPGLAPVARVPAHAVTFSQEYYQNVVRSYGYDTFELERFTFPLAGLGADELNVRWLCHHRAGDFVATPAGSRIVTTGFGMSGPPHMGTVSQILGINRLQAGGERCQIVLGDLDAHNGKGRPLAQTRELAERFSGFCRRLGFDETGGVIRSQFYDLDCLRHLYLLSFYADDADFDRAEEDNHGYYASLGVVDDRMTFRRKVSLALMASDFVTLGQQFDAVLVMLGIDEHKYVRFTREIAARLDGNTMLRGGFMLASIYSRMTAGFGGHPKMSKSIPASSINVESTPDQIVALVKSDEATTPETSPVYQLICQLFLRPYHECAALVDACATGSPAWTTAKAELADYLISVTELW
jgi:tryptophanyl-tRNA synthetase